MYNINVIITRVLLRTVPNFRFKYKAYLMELNNSYSPLNPMVFFIDLIEFA